MKTYPRILILGLLLFLLPLHSQAQKFAVKSNVLQWAAVAPNLGFEFRTGDKFTLEVSGSYNPFSFSDTKTYKFWLIQPEMRYWFCESFNGTFMGLHLHGGEFNLGNIKMPFGMWPSLKEHRYDGYYYGGGLSVGHHWIISRRWSIEATVGAGYVRIEYDKYRCNDCDPLVKSAHRNYFGPTKAAVSFIFLIK